MELKERVKEKKEEQQMELKNEEDRRNRAEKITSVEKRKALQAGLFASAGRKSLFQEALEG